MNKNCQQRIVLCSTIFLNYFILFFSLLWYGSPGGILRQVIWKKKKLPMHVWITRWTKIDIFPLVLDARWGRNLLLTAICALNCASPVNGQHLLKRSKKGWTNLLITCISHQIIGILLVQEQKFTHFSVYAASNTLKFGWCTLKSLFI